MSAETKAETVDVPSFDTTGFEPKEVEDNPHEVVLDDLAGEEVDEDQEEYVAGRRLSELIEALEDMPARRPVMLQVAAMTDDVEVSAATLAGMVAADAALSTRLLRVANSAYYGLSGRVSTLQYAITVLGFATVRAMALAAAVGADSDGDAPKGFWERAAIVGVATSVAARWTGARAPEALCVGLLHDLGKVLFHRVDQDGYTELLAEAKTEESLVRLEVERYGTDHALAAGAVLEAWKLPENLVRTVKTHNSDMATRTTPLERALAMGIVLADGMTTGRCDPVALQRASGGKVSYGQANSTITELRREAHNLIRALGGK